MHAREREGHERIAQGAGDIEANIEVHKGGEEGEVDGEGKGYVLGSIKNRRKVEPVPAFLG